MATITMNEARDLYRAGNDAGRGYAPGGSSDSIDDAVAYYLACGAEVVLARHTSDDVAVVRMYPRAPAEELIAIGGDARGNGAWAVVISD